MQNIHIDRMREEVTEIGAKELRTPDEVDATIPNSRGTMLVFINSVCGCAARNARPALKEAWNLQNRPDALVTVFAGQDIEATAQARQYFGTEPPSSPSFALLRDGKLIHMIHRYQIQHQSPYDVASLLKDAFDKYCTENVEI